MSASCWRSIPVLVHLGRSAWATQRSSAPLEDPQTARWFRRLGADIEVLAEDVRGHDIRLRLIQHRLMDILDIVGPEARRLPAELRKRVEQASPSKQRAARQG